MCLFESNPITDSDLAMKSNSTSVEMMAVKGAVLVSLTLNPAKFNSWLHRTHIVPNYNCLSTPWLPQSSKQCKWVTTVATSRQFVCQRTPSTTVLQTRLTEWEVPTPNHHSSCVKLHFKMRGGLFLYFVTELSVVDGETDVTQLGATVWTGETHAREVHTCKG